MEAGLGRRYQFSIGDLLVAVALIGCLIAMVRSLVSMPPPSTWHGNMYSVAYSPDGKTLAAGTEWDIRLWDVDTSQLRTLTGHRNIVRSIDFSRDGKWLVSGSWDGDVRLWDLKTGEGPPIPIGNVAASTVVFAPNGKTLAVADGGNGNVILWDIAARVGAPLAGQRSVAACRCAGFRSSR